MFISNLYMFLNTGQQGRTALIEIIEIWRSTTWWIYGVW